MIRRIDNPVTPLHVRSGYSMLRGTMHLPRLIERAAALGHRRIALADVNNLCGATLFWKQAVAAGLEPLLGAQLREDGASLLAMIDSPEGYANLCQILTRIALRDETPEAERTPGPSSLQADLAERQEGLQLVATDVPFARAMLTAGVKADRLWLGVDPAVQSDARVRSQLEAAGQLGIAPVATGAAMIADPSDFDAARLLAAIREGVTIDRLDPSAAPSPRAYLRSPGKLADSLAGYPAAAAGNVRLVERCAAFQLLPRRPVFPRFPVSDGSSERDMLRRLCREGMGRRYGDPAPRAAEIRLDRELRLIERMGFCGYFLVVWDIVQYARRRGAPVAGRGSGGSSIVAYVLGITNVCPVTYDIPFERFLHEHRDDFPDLDVDFCWRIRDDVIDYAFDRWGEDHTAMVSMHTSFQPRSAFRETAKAMGLSDAEISEIGRGSRDPATQVEGMEGIVALSRKILHLPHVLSVHPGGIVISPDALTRHAPLQRAAKGVLITQYDKRGVEDIRLVKLDLLGNRNLSTVRYAVDLIGRRSGTAPDIENLPPDDPPTVDRLRRGDTLGCNQLESPAMRHLLQMMQPGGTRDVMQALALIRPGAASIGMKDVFIRRRRGLETPPPAPPQVAGVLKRTHGVMLYEDDVMLLAASMLDAPLGEADRFRKAVQKCHDDAERLELSREFLRRCIEAGIDVDYARDIWVQMAKFNAYSFCRAHAGSYAILAYAGAYLRTHYPLEFWTAALNNNQSMYHPRVYVEQARRDGVSFALPDVNRSGAEFGIEQLTDPSGGEVEGIRMGLGLVEGLGPVGVEKIIDARRRGAYAGLSDLLKRTGLGENEARALVLCGGLDFTGRSRPTLMMELNLFYRMSPGRVPGGPTLFATSPVIPNAPGDYSPQRKFFQQRKVLGVSAEAHILSWFRPVLDRRLDADSRELSGRIGRRVRLAGMLEARRAAPTRGGEDMLFLTFDDEWGLFEVTVFPDVARPMRSRLDGYGPYVIAGVVERQHGCVTVTADRITLWDAPEVVAIADSA